MTATADEIPGISVAELEAMQTAAVDFLESQGISPAREEYYWPSNQTHQILGINFRELAEPWNPIPTEKRETYNKHNGMHLMTYRAENT